MSFLVAAKMARWNASSSTSIVCFLARRFSVSLRILLRSRILSVRWSRFPGQAAKVDLMTQRMIHHEDTQTVHG